MGILNRCFYLVLISLLAITIATVGDTITNVWGTVNYGWIDAETFGIQFQGSEQIRGIEQEWSESALLITNHARRFQDNLYAWQIRRSSEGEVLRVIPSDFGKARSYDSEQQHQETEEDASYSQFQIAFSHIFDSYKMIVGGDPITIHLSWGEVHLMFAFAVPAQPAPREGQ